MEDTEEEGLSVPILSMLPRQARVLCYAMQM